MNTVFRNKPVFVAYDLTCHFRRLIKDGRYRKSLLSGISFTVSHHNGGMHLVMLRFLHHSDDQTHTKPNRSFLSLFPILKDLVMGRKPLSVNFGVFNASILFCNYSSQLRPHNALIYCGLVWQQLDRCPVVKPTWLPSSNREANLRGHERLKYQLQETG